jgi:AraC-like DNA-binding protein
MVLARLVLVAEVEPPYGLGPCRMTVETIAARLHRLLDREAPDVNRAVGPGLLNIFARPYHLRSDAVLRERRERNHLAQARSVHHGLSRIGIDLGYLQGADLHCKVFGSGSFGLRFQLAGVTRQWLRGRRRQEIDVLPGSLVLRGTEEEYDVLHEDHSRLALSVSLSELQTRFERLVGRSVVDLRFDTIVDFRQGRAWSAFEYIALGVSQLIQHGRSASPIWRAELENMLISQIVLGLPHNQSHLLNGPPAMPAPRAVRRAEEYIRANATSALSLEEIAAAAGCSPRTLQRAFIHFRSMTPMGYLRRYRLEVAHKRLIAGDTSSVGALCTELGFSNPGRFAKEFRGLFGHSPMKLLQAADVGDLLR